MNKPAAQKGKGRAEGWLLPVQLPGPSPPMQMQTQPFPLRRPKESALLFLQMLHSATYCYKVHDERIS